MPDIRWHLIEADLTPAELSMRPDDAARIRQRMRAAATAPKQATRRRAMLLVVTAVSTGIAFYLSALRPPPKPAATSSPQATTAAPGTQVEPRQLHFVTAAGTRVIWIIQSGR
jgi:hypothetical protein